MTAAAGRSGVGSGVEVGVEVGACATPAALTLELPYQAPFDWPHLLGFLATRAIEGIECCQQGRYHRSLRIDLPGQRWRGRISVADDPPGRRLVVSADPAPPAVQAIMVARLRRLFDLDADPQQIAAVLGPLAADRPGLRLPGAVDGFEIAVRAVLGQQVSVKAARTLAGRVVARFGERLADRPDAGGDTLPSHSFPPPEALADLSLDGLLSGTDALTRANHPLTALGLTGQRARTLIALARALVERRVVLDADRQHRCPRRQCPSARSPHTHSEGDWPVGAAEAVASRPHPEGPQSVPRPTRRLQ